jgi:hypothetical protein
LGNVSRFFDGRVGIATTVNRRPSAFHPAAGRGHELLVELFDALLQLVDLGLGIGTEAVAESEKLCKEIQKEFPRAIFFMGKLIFQKEAWYYRFLHNETAYQLQRRLHFAGLNAIVLPVRLLTTEPAPLKKEPAAVHAA